MKKAKTLTVAEFLSISIASSDKTQAEIAKLCGFGTPNVLTMIKQGKMKVPIGRAPAIAKALGIEPYELIALAMSEYEPETWQAIQEHFTVKPIV